MLKGKNSCASWIRPWGGHHGNGHWERLGRFARKPIRKKWAALTATLYHPVGISREILRAIAFGARFLAARLPVPERFVFFGAAPGDDLLCTIVLRELRRRSDAVTAMVSNFPELFAGNADVDYVLPPRNSHSGDYALISVYRRLAQFRHGDFKQPTYARWDGKDQSEVPLRHIVTDMCASAGIRGSIAIRPDVVLLDDEKANAAWARGKVVIQSGGMAKRLPMLNKEWVPGRFQEVVDALRGEFEFVQVGVKADPPLRHVVDLRGATSLRETAAVLFQARLFIGLVGFLMHLARAVECPGVIIYGGREAPWQSGYLCNFNIHSALPCAPCWRWNSCEFDRKCMTDITVDQVVAGVREMLARPRNPLAVEIAEIA